MTSAVRGILFDKDGTLTDYAASWVPTNIEAAQFAAAGDADLAARLLELGGQDVRTNRVAPGSLLAAANTIEIAQAWHEAGSPYDVRRLTRELDAIFTSAAEASVAVPGIADLFERLRLADIGIGVATSDSAASAHATLSAIGVRADFVAGYDSGHGAKPEPGMALAFAADRRLPTGDCMMVGDNLHDIRMGRAAGFGICVGVLTGTGTRQQLEREADHVIEEATALVTILGWAV